MLFRHRVAVAIAATAALFGSPSHAHLSLDQGTTHKSRYGDAEIKDGPCGREGGVRGENVYTHRPGETITVEVVEFVGHPGYFRIAFDDDGDDAFVDPQSVAPLNRECMNVAEDHCGEPDFFNNDAVLMENLEPHVPAGFESRTYSWEVTLPAATCDNCTLQVIQIMTDAPGIHAPYDPNSPTADDIYYQCIDLVLEGEPIGGSPSPTEPGDAGGAEPPAAGGAGNTTDELEGDADSGDDGSCTVARAPSSSVACSWPLTALTIAALAVRRRIRRERRSDSFRRRRRRRGLPRPR